MAQKLVVASPSIPPWNIRLPIRKFEPDTWDDTFTSFSQDVEVQERYAKEIETLKKEVKKKLIGEGNNKLILIDNLERLGVAYHFEHEINEQLQHIFNFHSEDYGDLFTTALCFRLLRQHHHHVSSRIFEKFKGEDGKFDEGLGNDAKGLLNLYEAAHLRTNEEAILEEGLVFSTHHLNLMVSKLECPLQDQVKRAILYPLHKGFPRIETWHYISFYERDNLHDEVLLKLAKLDFNYVQNLYKKEIHNLSKWWKKFDLKSKLTYARDRLGEAFTWAIGLHFEPEDSFLRSSLVKCILVTSILDDTYDNYATIEEAEVFTQCLQRWDIDETEELPTYMQVVYSFILTTYDELQHEASERGISFAAPHIKEAIIELAQSYNVELKWFSGMEVPTSEAYDSNIIFTSAIFMLCTPSLLGLRGVKDRVFDWLLSKPKFVVAAAKVSRYVDDLATYEREEREGQMLTAISIYMKQHDASKEMALNKFGEMIDDVWKVINEEWLNLPSEFHDAADIVINFARTVEIFYKNGQDIYSFPRKTEIANLLVEPLVI